MAASEEYRRQAALLVRAIPLVADRNLLRPQGRTAINLFVRDMPRLSVDIDLTYLPVEDRATSLAKSTRPCSGLTKRIREGLRGATVTSAKLKSENIVSKILSRRTASRSRSR